MASNPKLIILSKSLRGQSFMLDTEVTGVGRTENSKVYLPDGTISTDHAEIVRDADGSYTVRDLGSTNGSRVNGTKITEQKLVSGDVVQFGGVELLFDAGEDRSDSHITKTAIDITKTAGTIELPEFMENASPIGNSGGDGKTARLVFKLIVFVLVIAIVVLGTNILLDLLDKA